MRYSVSPSPDTCAHAAVSWAPPPAPHPGSSKHFLPLDTQLSPLRAPAHLASPHPVAPPPGARDSGLEFNWNWTSFIPHCARTWWRGSPWHPSLLVSEGPSRRVEVVCLLGGLPLGCELLGIGPGVPRIPTARAHLEHRTHWWEGEGEETHESFFLTEP